MGVVVVQNMVLNAVGERGLLSGKLCRSTDYRSFTLAIQRAYIIANGAAGSVITACDHRGQAVNEMELGSLSNLDGNIRDRYSGDEFGYARSNALGFIPTAIHVSNKILSRVVGSA